MVPGSELRELADVTSAVSWAVLGLVIEKPSHAYEIWKRFESRFGGGLLNASRPHIYAVLGTLEDNELIERLPGRRTGRRQQTVPCRATAKGARAYREWLAGQVRDDPKRTALLRGLVSAYAVDAGSAQRLLDSYAHQCLAEQSSIELPSGEERSVDARIDHLLVQERRIALRAQLEWVGYAKRKLEAWAAGMPEQGAGEAAARGEAEEAG